MSAGISAFTVGTAKVDEYLVRHQEDEPAP